MKTLLTLLYLAVLTIVAIAHGAPLERLDIESPPPNMDLRVGESLVLTSPGLKRVLLSKSRVVTAKSIDSAQLLIVGRQTGETEMLLWNHHGALTKHRIRVVDDAFSSLERQVETLVRPPSQVRVQRDGSRLLVTGQVHTDEEFQAVRALASSTQGVEVAIQKSDEERMIAMEVRFLEVKKNAMESLGFNWQKSLAGPIVAVVGDVASNKTFRPQGAPRAENAAGSVALNLPSFTSEQGQPAAGRVAPFSTYIGLQTSLLSIINLMEQSGQALVLAEPTLTCRSGGQARFLAGGEIPLPTSSALGGSSVQFKPYGIRFEVAPVSRPGGLIEAKITTELSTVDPAIKVGELPGFLSRMTQSEVTMREGQTLVLSGLISEEGSFSRDKLAGLADLPAIGALFRSRDFLERRSELVVLLTPRRVTSASDLNLSRIREAEQSAVQFRSALSAPTTHQPSMAGEGQHD